MSKPKPRNRRTNRELFLAALQELSGGEQKFISNKTLREKLAWDDDKYARIKAQLKEDGSVVSGRGWGGSVGLGKPDGAKSLNVFISYSHLDEVFKDKLVKHLTPLKQMGLIEAWHDRKITAGSDWKDIIDKNLKGSHIIILLVSIDFINSKYCYEIELEEALEMHDAKKARIIPVILRNCIWHHTPFAKIQAIPKDGKPVSTWADVDEALTSVAESVKQAADELLNS